MRLLAKGVNALERKCLKRPRLGGAYGCISEAKDQIIRVAGRPSRTDAEENYEVFCFDQVRLSARASTSELGLAAYQHFAVLRNRALGQLENLERTAFVRATATDYTGWEYLGQSDFNVHHMVSILDELCVSSPDILVSIRSYQEFVCTLAHVDVDRQGHRSDCRHATEVRKPIDSDAQIPIL